MEFENCYGYANNSVLVTLVPSPGENFAVAESQNFDLTRE